jgi:hypothetical protein
MKTVYELIKSTNDILNVYKLGEVEPELIEVNASEIEQIVKDKTKGICYLIPPHLHACDAYENDCTTEHSNIRLFLEKYKESTGFRHITGAYNFEVIAIDITCEDANMIEILEYLGKHPAINA